MEKRIRELSTEMGKLIKTSVPIKMKDVLFKSLRNEPPKLDRKVLWATHRRQFEAAAQANEWNDYETTDFIT